MGDGGWCASGRCVSVCVCLMCSGHPRLRLCIPRWLRFARPLASAGFLFGFLLLSRPHHKCMDINPLRADIHHPIKIYWPGIIHDGVPLHVQNDAREWCIYQPKKYANVRRGAFHLSIFGRLNPIQQPTEHARSISTMRDETHQPKKWCSQNARLRAHVAL